MDTKVHPQARCGTGGAWAKLPGQFLFRNMTWLLMYSERLEEKESSLCFPLTVFSFLYAVVKTESTEDALALVCLPQGELKK